MDQEAYSHMAEMARQTTKPHKPAEPPRSETSTTEARDAAAWLNRHLTHVGVPVRHRVTEPRPDGTAWWDWMAKAADLMGKGSIVILAGDRGSGKTQIGAQLIKAAILSQRRPAARYAHIMDFYLTIRSGYVQNGQPEAQLVGAFTRPCLLVLDEIQDRGETQWEDRMLRYVIDKRYAAMLDTVLISNASRSALLGSDGQPGMLGKSVASRLMEGGTFIECVGVNWRKDAMR